jgi:hypothetical protein
MFEDDYPSWTRKSTQEEAQGDWSLGQMFEDDYPEWARKSAQQEADGETGDEVQDGFIDEIQDEVWDGEEDEPKQEFDGGSDVDDEIRYNLECDCHRRRGYCSIEIRRYGPGKWSNVGDFLVQKLPSYHYLSVDSEDEDYEIKGGLSVLRALLRHDR